MMSAQAKIMMTWATMRWTTVMLISVILMNILMRMMSVQVLRHLADDHYWMRSTYWCIEGRKDHESEYFTDFLIELRTQYIYADTCLYLSQTVCEVLDKNKMNIHQNNHTQWDVKLLQKDKATWHRSQNEDAEYWFIDDVKDTLIEVFHNVLTYMLDRIKIKSCIFK